MLRSKLPIALATFAIFSGPLVAADLPRIFNHMVKGARLRPVAEMQLGAEAFESMAVFSALPYLLWRPDPAAPQPVARDREAVRRWLDGIGDALGHGELVPRFEFADDWLGLAKVWRYGLELDGVPVWGYGVNVYWQGDRLVGLVNDVLGPTAEVAELPAERAGDLVLLPRRRADDRYALDRARVTTQTVGRRTLTTVQGPQTAFSSWAPAPPAQSSQVAKDAWKEWPLPVGFGSFPDQIDTDSSGRVWFSQPNSNQITLFDPATEQFTKYPVTAGNGPDGLIVASDDLVYSGLYFTGELGIFDPQTLSHTSFAAPYSGAALAIPTETSAGTIVVTDHSGRVLEWDPVSQLWIKNLTTPTASPHIVAGVEGDGQIMWFTEYNVNKLARLDLATGLITEIDIPGGGGPAFPAWSMGKVWFSLWNLARMGAYDPVSGQFTFYDLGASNVGGPFFAAPNGDVICGTRNSGTIEIYRAQLGFVVSYKIPTSFPGLKDGLTVGADGTVWITESGVNRIGRLKYPH